MAQPESVALARAMVAELGHAAGVDERCLPELELMASELVTNALEHGGDPVRLTVLASVGEVRVEVFDAGRDMPVHDGFPPPHQEHGRGLLIVSALSDRFGVDAEPAGGKTVWFERAVS